MSYMKCLTLNVELDNFDIFCWLLHPNLSPRKSWRSFSVWLLVLSGLSFQGCCVKTWNVSLIRLSCHGYLVKAVLSRCHGCHNIAFMLRLPSHGLAPSQHSCPNAASLLQAALKQLSCHGSPIKAAL